MLTTLQEDENRSNSYTAPEVFLRGRIKVRVKLCIQSCVLRQVLKTHLIVYAQEDGHGEEGSCNERHCVSAGGVSVHHGLCLHGLR